MNEINTKLGGEQPQKGVRKKESVKEKSLMVNVSLNYTNKSFF